MGMKDKLRQFMIGRYGVDQLGKFIMWVGLGLLILSMFIRVPFLSTLPFFILILCYVRMFSRNISKRYGENQKYLSYVNRIKNYFAHGKDRRMQKKNYHIYPCPTCKQKIRVPKGKGKICITCPKCHAEFIKRS